MGLFGRTSCNEDRSWRVEAIVNRGSVILTEQLNEAEAKEFYNKLMTEIKNNKSGFIKVAKDEGDNYKDKTYFLNLANIEYFKLYSY